MTPRFSVIIPVRNDEEALLHTLESLACLERISEAEIVVVASKAQQDLERTDRGRTHLIRSQFSSRAALMNEGATSARGTVFLFLHADSTPPVNAFKLIDSALSNDQVVGGAFEHCFAETNWSLRAVSWINRIRYRLTRVYYGDQGIFVRAEIFRRMNGYRDIGFLEDLDFSRRAKRMGRVVLIRVPVICSGRRFLTRGPWRTFFFIVWVLFLYVIGLDTQCYAEYWRGPADQPPGSPWCRRPKKKF